MIFRQCKKNSIKHCLEIPLWKTYVVIYIEKSASSIKTDKKPLSLMENIEIEKIFHVISIIKCIKQGRELDIETFFPLSKPLDSN